MPVPLSVWDLSEIVVKPKREEDHTPSNNSSNFAPENGWIFEDNSGFAIIT